MNDPKGVGELPPSEVSSVMQQPETTLLGSTITEEKSIKDHTIQQQVDDSQRLPAIQPSNNQQLFQAQMKNDYPWDKFLEALEYTPLAAAIAQWLSNLKPKTARNYAYYINGMRRYGLFPHHDEHGNTYTVGHFRHERHELVLDYLKKIDKWAEGTRQVRCACYISLTAYLERISRGWFRKVQPSVLAANPTFFQTHDKCVTRALTMTEWHRFIDALATINARDCLIARCMLQGAKRVSEAIELTLDQIDWDRNIIRFLQKKTGGMIKEIPITYPQHYMDALQSYIAATAAQRKEARFVFITRTGKMITRLRLNYSFARASEVAGIKKVSPHVLRATWITLAKLQNLQDTEIMKITGHTSSKMIYSYDKSSPEDNFSKKFVLI